LTPGRRGGKPAINRLSYGAAFLDIAHRKYGEILYFKIVNNFLSFLVR
jgi:hypothetical protein